MKTALHAAAAFILASAPALGADAPTPIGLRDRALLEVLYSTGLRRIAQSRCHFSRCAARRIADGTGSGPRHTGQSCPDARRAGCTGRGLGHLVGRHRASADRSSGTNCPQTGSAGQTRRACCSACG